MKKLWFAIVLLVLFITKAFWFQAGIPYTHDGENHLARFANYKVAVREGQIPPRFAPNLLNHYGYPVFNYNYPLANIISVPLSVIGIGYETIFKLIALAFLCFGSMGVIRWLRYYTQKKLPILLALIAYLSGPPLISTLLFRGNIGEIVAYGLLPWLFWSLQRLSKPIKQKHFLCIVGLWSAFLLSHNISVLIALYIFGVYSAWLFFLKTNRKQFIVQLILAAAASIGLTAWFWFPAVLELGEVVISGASNQLEYALHFPTLSQLIYSPLQFGFSYPGPVDDLSFWVGWMGLAALAGVLIYGLQYGITKYKSILKVLHRFFHTQYAPFLVLSVLTLLLQLQWSEFFWKIFPAFNNIQFPWRLGLVFCVITLPLIVGITTKFSKTIFKLIFVCIALTQLVLVLQASPKEIMQKPDIEYELHGGTTSTLNENMTYEFKYLLIGDWQPSPSVLSGDAEIVTVEQWSGSRREYRINVYTPAVIVEPTMNFLGWQTKARSITDETWGFNQIPYTDSDEIQGRIAYQLEPGFYHVVSRFTQQTNWRLLGNSLFVVTLLLLVGSSLVSAYGQKKRQ